MRCSRLPVLLALLAVLCCTAGCHRRARVIPAKTLTRIYTEMYLTDQWLRDHVEERKVADTSLVFDPIFRRYGYTFADYDKSIHYYIDRPDKYAKILSGASERIRLMATTLQAELDSTAAREARLDEFRRLFHPKDFSSDSLRWAAPGILWPRQVAADSLATADSLAVADTLAAADSLAVSDTLAIVDKPVTADTLTVRDSLPLRPSRIVPADSVRRIPARRRRTEPIRELADPVKK